MQSRGHTVVVVEDDEGIRALMVDFLRDEGILVEEARDAGVPALLFCYALGKAQRILAELAARGIDRPAYAHGAMLGMTELYRAQPQMPPMLELRSATEAKKIELEGALVLAPLSARGTSWIRRFGKARTGFASGWMQVRGDRFDR